MLPINIIDPRFKVKFLKGSKQENPDQAVWEGMHQCFSDGSVKSGSLHTNNPVKSVIENALKFGHWDVLCYGYVGLQFTGFPHSTAMQFRTHKRLQTLVQSMRYTGDRFIECANEEENVENLFYLREPSSEGWDHCYRSCVMYRDEVEAGANKESARDLLASGYRQGFTIGANFKEWMHMLDRRLLADTQLESRIAAQMALDLLCDYSEFFVWYKNARAGKNKLAP